MKIAKVLTLCHVIWIFAKKMANVRQICHFRQNRHFQRGPHLPSPFDLYLRLVDFRNFRQICHFRQNRHFQRGPLCHLIWLIAKAGRFLPNSSFPSKSALSKGPFAILSEFLSRTLANIFHIHHLNLIRHCGQNRHFQRESLYHLIWLIAKPLPIFAIFAFFVKSTTFQGATSPSYLTCSAKTLANSRHFRLICHYRQNRHFQRTHLPSHLNFCEDVSQNRHSEKRVFAMS